MHLTPRRLKNKIMIMIVRQKSKNTSLRKAQVPEKTREFIQLYAEQKPFPQMDAERYLDLGQTDPECR